MNKQYLMLFIVSLLVMAMPFAVGCTDEAIKPNKVTETPVIKDIGAEEAFALIQDNRDNLNFIIIDVRTPEEFTEGHIDNAVNIDFRSENFNNKIDKLDKNKTYLIYCRSGARSREALKVMEELDFKFIYHLEVGIIGWLDEELPTVK